MERFFIKDLTEELTQRNLKSSSRVNATPQSDIIRNLERENLYLKNQLFALIQVLLQTCRIQVCTTCTYLVKRFYVIVI
jgi:hypothetical protein